MSLLKAFNNILLSILITPLLLIGAIILAISTALVSLLTVEEKEDQH